MSNNRLNDKIDNYMPHKFSLCDVDGVIRWNNKESIPSRVIFFEWKETNEKLSTTQKETLIEIAKNFNWDKYDKLSGVYIIKAVEKYPDLDYVDVSSIMDCDNYNRMSFSSLYLWFNPNGNENELNLSNKGKGDTIMFELKDAKKKGGPVKEMTSQELNDRNLLDRLDTYYIDQLGYRIKKDKTPNEGFIRSWEKGEVEKNISKYEYLVEA